VEPDDNGVYTWRNISAVYETFQQHNLTNVTNSAYYNEEIWSGSGLVQSITASGLATSLWPGRSRKPRSPAL